MKKALAGLALMLFWIPSYGGAEARGKGFAPLPAQKGRSTRLEIRFVEYKGGQVIADVRNRTRRPLVFDPQGLYFVPDGNPEKAPQRMGAAGTFEVLESEAWKVRDKMKVAAKKVMRVRLQVFCLDSHRASPSNGQGFSVARRRLPRGLQKRIVKGANSALMGRGARQLPSARNSAQAHIWKVRNSRWIRLEGERRNEKPSGRFRSSQRGIRYRIQRTPRPRPSSGNVSGRRAL